MRRDRSYYRRMRAKHIKRKKSLSSYYWYYEYDGMYSKGKIHCSCPLCRAKTRNRGRGRVPYAPSLNYKPSDLRKLQKMEYDLEEYAS